MTDRQLEGRLLFPHPVVFVSALQDSRWDITIGGADALIALPCLPDQLYRDDSEPELLPPSVAPTEIVNKPKRSWGQVVTNRHHFRAECACLSVALPEEGQGFDDVRDADHQLRSWLATLMDWLRVLTGQDLRRAGPLFWENPEITPGWFCVREDGEFLGDYYSANYYSASGHPPPYPGETATDEQDWGRAIDFASQGSAPDEARLFLSDAMGNLLRQHPRRALVDAATAAELLVSSTLRARILEQNNETRAASLLDRATLGRKVTLCGKFGIWHPVRFRQRVVSVRNDVLHRGVHPTSNEARLAIVETSKLMQHHFPFEWESRYDPQDDIEDDKDRD